MSALLLEDEDAWGLRDGRGVDSDGVGVGDAETEALGRRSMKGSSMMRMPEGLVVTVVADSVRFDVDTVTALLLNVCDFGVVDFLVIVGGAADGPCMLESEPEIDTDLGSGGTRNALVDLEEI